MSSLIYDIQFEDLIVVHFFNNFITMVNHPVCGVILCKFTPLFQTKFQGFKHILVNRVKRLFKRLYRFLFSNASIWWSNLNLLSLVLLLNICYCVQLVKEDIGYTIIFVWISKAIIAMTRNNLWFFWNVRRGWGR